MTFFYKRVFPRFWFGFLGVFLTVALVGTLSQRQPPREIALFVLAPIGMAVLGYILFRFIIFDLADEVLDDGDCLVVKFRRRKHCIPLSNIKNVHYNGFVNPPRITLMLRQPVDGFDAVAFSPTFRFFQQPLHPTARSLRERIDAIRISP